MNIFSNTFYVEVRLEYHTDNYNDRAIIAYVEVNKVCLIVYKICSLTEIFVIDQDFI